MKKALATIGKLADDPRPPGCKKLVGSASTYRIRLGQYRVVYEVDDDQHMVFVTRVRHRKEAYD